MEQTVKLYGVQNQLINDAYSRIVFNLCMHQERHGYKVFALCGCEPGVGTTSVALDLSILLSQIGWKTILLDGDLRKGKQYKRIHNENPIDTGLADYIIGQCSKKDMLYATNWENLTYIPCGSPDAINPLQALSSSNMAGLFQELSAEYDCIIVDTPSLSAAVDSKFYAMRADATILIAAVNGNRKKPLEETYNQLLGCNANVIGVIETKVALEEYKNYTKDFDYFAKRKFAGAQKRKENVSTNE